MRGNCRRFWYKLLTYPVLPNALTALQAVNLVAPIRLMGGVVGIMREQKGGVIVNVASRAGATGATAGVSYTTSKWGLVSILS